MTVKFPTRSSRRRPSDLQIRRTSVSVRALATALLSIGLVACDGSDTDVTALTPETFADVIVELREAEWEALETDSAVQVYARRKAEILEHHGTSEQELRRFVELSSRDLPLLDELWEDISQRLRRPMDAPEDST